MIFLSWGNYSKLWFNLTEYYLYIYIYIYGQYKLQALNSNYARVYVCMCVCVLYTNIFYLFLIFCLSTFLNLVLSFYFILGLLDL